MPGQLSPNAGQLCPSCAAVEVRQALRAAAGGGSPPPGSTRKARAWLKPPALKREASEPTGVAEWLRKAARRAAPVDGDDVVLVCDDDTQPEDTQPDAAPAPVPSTPCVPSTPWSIGGPAQHSKRVELTFSIYFCFAGSRWGGATTWSIRPNLTLLGPNMTRVQPNLRDFDRFPPA